MGHGQRWVFRTFQRRELGKLSEVGTWEIVRGGLLGHGQRCALGHCQRWAFKILSEEGIVTGGHTGLGQRVGNLGHCPKCPPLTVGIGPAARFSGVQ